MIVQGCSVHGGAQGGIFAVDGAKLSLNQSHFCHNAATGLELREGAVASLDACYFYNNGNQGII
eukprot:CAMPEP_0197823710 /NCGR_PEP_ID=MMETSP1437-20131217/1038_1 /TAXON_ID=49252 ORGANISM="Eucampia antarctica, Strain CCMP1452" /NCGR_SAMPLE_ID=MMETSP1437 /ASSEMBLY_ACC=CAM_ASM_001096 /LENGTH=63 /DNA_ID=CAMNT_0043423015 /DNA_START=1023 /DNA_END=1211 /DNA_ORIENTATION=+